MLFDKKEYNIVVSILLILLCIMFVVTCIMASPQIDCLLMAEIMILISFLDYTMSGTKKNILIILKVIFDVLIFMLGSFSDEITVIVIMCIYSIMDIILNEVTEINIYIWNLYSIECEVLGILLITGIATLKSRTFMLFLQSFIIDIIFATTVAMTIYIRKSKMVKVIKKVNIFFVGGVVLILIGSVVFLNIAQHRHERKTSNIIYENSGECVIKSAVLENMAITMDGENYVNGANIVLEKNTCSDKQIFTFRKTIRDTYTFEINNTLLMLDVAGGSREKGANVQLWELNNELPQEWKITMSGNGNYILTSACNDFNLDVDLGISTSEFNIMTFIPNGNKSQEYIIDVLENNKFVKTYIWDTEGVNGIMAYKSLIESTIIMLMISTFIIYKRLTNKNLAEK